MVSTVLAAASMVGCAAETPATPPSSVRLPPVAAAPDYQLGGAYDPPAGVGVAARDRTVEPAVGVYSICYVNAFQTQPGELDAWPDDLVLRDDHGEPVLDPDWPDEALLDTSTEARRDQIATIVGPWIVGCAEAGFDGVEFDNLDSYTRSDAALGREDNLALARDLVGVAHDAGLAAGQKNAAEDSGALRTRAGFDFAVAEECGDFDECDTYTEVYGDHVIDIEYTDGGPDFSAACAEGVLPDSVVLRDRDLVTPDEAGYVFELC